MYVHAYIVLAVDAARSQARSLAVPLTVNELTHFNKLF